METMRLVRHNRTVTPLRYPGGKAGYAHIFVNMLMYALLKCRNTTSLVAPFMGGSSIEIGMALKGIRVLASDRNSGLCNFFDCIKKDPVKLASTIEAMAKKHGFPADSHGKKVPYEHIKKFCMEKDEFKKIAAMSDPPNGNNAAASYFIRNKMQHSGNIATGGLVKPNNQRLAVSSINKVKNFKCDMLETRQALWQEAMDAVDPDILAYLDPPYHGVSHALYDGHASFDHAELASYLKKRGNFIMSYGNSAHIRSLYEWAHVMPAKWPKSMGNEIEKDCKELVIASKDLFSNAEEFKQAWRLSISV